MAAAPLIERKQQQARRRIIEAATELFAAHGFDGVSVADIARHAEVGRTTFFRHFGDKQEVVFAREHEMLEQLTADNLAVPAGGDRTVGDALEVLQPLVLRLCTLIASDPEEYRRHVQLITDNPELQARDAVKMQLVARRLSAMLGEHGWETAEAVLAAQIAIACYWTARASDGGAETLVEASRESFARVLALGTT